MPVELKKPELHEGDVIYLEEGTDIHLLECYESGPGWWKGIVNSPKGLLAGSSCQEVELTIKEEKGKKILTKDYTWTNPISGHSQPHSDCYEIISINKAVCKKKTKSFQKYHNWLKTIYDKDEMTFEEAAALLKPIEDDQLCLKTAVDHSTVDDAIRLVALMALAGLALTEKQFKLFRKHTYIH